MAFFFEAQSMPVPLDRCARSIAAERLIATKLIERWRCRLYDISWFMH